MQIGRSLGKKKFTNLGELATRCITKEGAYKKETICIINWLNNPFIFTLRPCRPVSETIHENVILLRTNVLIGVFMMEEVYTWVEYISDFALGIQSTYSFEEYFILRPPQCFILWSEKTT